MTVPQLQHMAPVLVVDRVEPGLTFWLIASGSRSRTRCQDPTAS